MWTFLPGPKIVVLDVSREIHVLFGTGIAVAQPMSGKRLMKNNARKQLEGTTMQSANFVAVLAIVTEMARRVNKNIAKVQLKPLDESLVSAASREQAGISKA